MNKSKFLELVKHPGSIEENDLIKLEELVLEHPYSQIGHVLYAKGLKSCQKPDFEKALNRAATYACDRILLRSIIEGEPLPVTSVAEPIEEIIEEPDEIVEEVSDFEWIHQGSDQEEELSAETTESVDEIYDLESPAEEAEENIEETSISDSEATDDTPGDDVVSGEKEEQTGTEKPMKPKAENEDTPDKDIETSAPVDNVAAELQEISDSLEDFAEAEAPKGAAASGTSDKSQEVEGEPVQPEADGEESLNLEIEAASIHAELMQNLSQLQETKQQYESPVGDDEDPESRQEQIEIIDNFIKNSPVLSKPNLSAESEIVSQDDLSKSSTRLSEELASENLAKIYLKQGKRKDAEKIYKKLIRKFPQKKAYFADQIQKLKKK